MNDSVTWFRNDLRVDDHEPSIMETGAMLQVSEMILALFDYSSI